MRGRDCRSLELQHQPHEFPVQGIFFVVSILSRVVSLTHFFDIREALPHSYFGTRTRRDQSVH